MSDYLWRGTTQMTPGKEKWSYTATKISVDLTWSGPYADIASAKPLFGQVLAGYENLFVTKVDVEELNGGAGHLAVTIEAQVDASPLSYAPLGPSVFELEFAEVSKPLEMHPLCGILKSTRTPNAITGKKLTWEDWSLLTANDYDDSGSGTGIWDGVEKWSLAIYQAKKAKGQDSYVVYAPVIRRTTIHLYPPPDCGSASGKLQTPPSSGFDEVDDWQWLGGADRVTRSARTFTRVTEWMGAEYWDTTTYVNA